MPNFCFKLRYKILSRHRTIHRLMWFTCAVVLFTIYVLAPFLYYYVRSIQRGLIFVPFVRTSPQHVLEHPEENGLPGTKNFYLTTSSNICLGVWHVLPESLSTSPDISYPDFYENSLKGPYPVIVYMHGNSGSRAHPHRIELYQMLRKLDVHIITFDYRGYADSSKVGISESGVLEDGLTVIKWVRKYMGPSTEHLIVWGHSLGTGISTRVVSELSKKAEPPSALVLESPFTNIKDEVRNHPLSVLHRKMPWFNHIFLDSLTKSDINFQSDKNILNIRVPLLILHAEDDLVVPYKLGRKLYKIAEEQRPIDAAPVKFYGFRKEFQYGHTLICRAPELSDIVRKFISSIETESIL